jgi:poly(A) polymerase
LSLQIDPEALSILVKVDQFLSERQIESYLVGGFVRDSLIGRSTGDIDVAVSADVLKMAPEMAASLGGKFVLLDEANRIARVVLFPPEEKSNSESPSKRYWYVDLSTLAGNIHQDLERRDFTIDAMAIELKSFIQVPASFKIIDPAKGLDDLNRRVIRAVNEGVFEADPARLLRAVRLSAELGFMVVPETVELIRRFSPLITRVAGERVREELLRILAAAEAGQSMRFLDDLGLLTTLIPELEPSRGVEQPKEHHWDVLNHSLETVRAVDFVLRQGQWEHVSNEVLAEIPWSEKLRQHFTSEVSNGSTRAGLLKLAALLHDIAKPETKIISNDKVRFFGHTEKGAEVVAKILERLRFSNKEIKTVEMMVRYHLRPTQMSHEGMPTQRAIYRYFRDTGTAGIDILFLSLADHLAARGPDLDKEQWIWHTGQVNCILVDCFSREGVVTPLKLIDGHDLINLFGLKPGPELREILESVKESQAAGEVTTREEALSYVQNRLLYKRIKIEE